MLNTAAGGVRGCCHASAILREAQALGHCDMTRRNSRGKIVCEEALDALRGLGVAVNDDEGCAALAAFVCPRGSVYGEPRCSAGGVEKSAELWRIDNRLAGRA